MKTYYIILIGIYLIISCIGNIIVDNNRMKIPNPTYDTVYNGIKPLTYRWVDDNHFTIYIDTPIIKNK